MTKRHFIITAAILAAIPLIPEIAWGQAVSVQVNGISLRYEVEGSGKPLVLVHGWAVHRGFGTTTWGALRRTTRSFVTTAEALANRAGGPISQPTPPI